VTTLLDASAVLAFLQDEPGQDEVAWHVESSVIAAPNWAEVVQKVRSHPGSATLEVLSGLLAVGLEIEPLWPDDATRAGEIWEICPTLSLADRCCLAVAERMEVPVLTADAAWADCGLDIEVRVIR
jgi:PIN domain nuclease of toxin-antitoxin system